MRERWTCLLAVLALLSALGLTAASRAQAQGGLPLGRFDFDSADVPLEVRLAIVRAVAARPPGLLPGDLFVVGVYRRAEGWGFGSLAAWQGASPPEWDRSVWFIAQRGEGGDWEAALQGTARYSELLDQSPDAFISPLDKELLDSGPSLQGTDLKFPWDRSQRWVYTSSWHSGNALDFAPSDVPADRRWVLAAADGIVRITCDVDGQASIRLENGTLGNTSYVHLRSASIPREVVDGPVAQGRQLADLFDSTVGRGYYRIDQLGWPSCDPNVSPPCNWDTRSGCCWLAWNSVCGRGTGPHLHWVLPSQNVTVDGWTVDPTGCWTRDGTVQCWGSFASTNVRSTSSVNLPPRPPTPQSPADGTWFGSRAATLAWQDGGDPDDQPRDYREFYVELWSVDWRTTHGWTADAAWQAVVPRDGAYAWRVRAGDGAAESAWSETQTYHVDASRPTAPAISVAGAGCGDAYNNLWQNACPDPAFTWSAADPGGSGIQGYECCWSTGPDCAPATWTAGPGFDPPAIAAPDGVAAGYLNLRARDGMGHDSSLATFGLRYDGSPPTASLRINGGAETAHQVSVDLHLSTSDVGSGVSEVCVSHRPDECSDWHALAVGSGQVPSTGSGQVPWTLPALDRRTHAVYVWVRDQAGNVSPAISDTIALDLYPAMPHSASYRICADAVNAAGSAGLTSASYALVSAVGQSWGTGADSGASAHYRGRSGFLADLGACLPISCTATEHYTLAGLAVASGGSLRGSALYHLGDTLGQPAASGLAALTSASYHLSGGFWAAITGTVPPAPALPVPPTALPPLATPAPRPTPEPQNFGISVNDGDPYTNDPAVQVRAWAPNVTQMRLSNDGSYADQGWGPYQITTTWVLSTAGSDVMPRTVYAWFRDAGGGVYGPYVDDIVLDRVTPWGQASVVSGQTPTVTLQLEAWDDNSGVSLVRISGVPTMTASTVPGDAAEEVPWQPYQQVLEWALSGDVVYVQFRDGAGNLSSVYGAPARKAFMPLVLRNAR